MNGGVLIYQVLTIQMVICKLSGSKYPKPISKGFLGSDTNRMDVLSNAVSGGDKAVEDGSK